MPRYLVTVTRAATDVEVDAEDEFEAESMALDEVVDSVDVSDIQELGD